MIQRKQTIFLLIAVILGMVHFQAWSLFAVQILASAISLIAIFLYKRRPLQATLCLVAILVNLAWYVVLAVLIQQGSQAEALPLTAALPIVAAMLCLLARRGIQADEKLVRAADRLR
jgi:peptidoglycan/LPS O-acetylase OafA/YrhL